MIEKMSLTVEASKLLDFNQKLDIPLLDNVIGFMYNGIGEQQRIAQEVLTTLKEHPDAWTRVDAILEYSQNQQTKYYALQILEQVINTKWKVLPRDQCEGIKKYIVNVIIKLSSTAESLERERVYLNKLNMILVQILKREWPKNWQSFIPDIVGASKTNESMCQNNMVILKLLSEEVFDFSTGQMTQTKAKHLKDTMCSQFQQVFLLCIFVMENSQNPTLVSATLETLLRFLNWIPLGYIFETKLISTLIYKFLGLPLFRNVTLKCLTEIAGVAVPSYDESYIMMFSQTITQLQEMLPLETNIREAYANGQDAEQQFIQNLALFLCTFLKERGSLVEKKQLSDALIKALQYLILISEVDDTEIFKICLEYWNALASDLYRESPFLPPTSASPLYLPRPNSRRQFYQTILTKVRALMISRMAKPEEVLVVENEQGEVVREFMRDTDSINMYKNMRETLVYLTHLDYADTERIMTEKLANQVNGSEWSWRNLNTLCWAVGSISGAMPEEDEKRFLVIVIKDLLGLCEQKRGKDNKAIIASNIMYIVGQYPRFLRIHWRFLKTVINKLFEFMHETHDGVQDMACDTFIKIAQKCRRQFVQMQVGEAMPFIEEILSSINSIICDLQPQQVHTFYEAVGYMISAQTDQVIQDHLIGKYMMLPNQVWDEIINQASRNVDILKDPDVVKQLSNILKTNVRACKALGHPFVSQLGRIYLDMLNVYKVMSENISAAIALNGEGVTKQPLIKSMRVVKKETLKLISGWVSRSYDHTLVLDNFIPPLLEAVLMDYQRTGVPSAREPEVLSTMATIVNKLESHITQQVPKIFDAVFQCTLAMINKDFEEFPEHRTNFFLLLQVRKSSTRNIFVKLLFNIICPKPVFPLFPMEFNKPGWNDHISDLFQASRDARTVWLDHNEPRQGPIFNMFTRLKAKCKYAIRYIKNNENLLRKEAMAKNFSSKDTMAWKDIEKMHTSSTPVPVSVDGVCGSENIANLWKTHYHTLFNSVGHRGNPSAATTKCNKVEKYDTIKVTHEEIKAAISRLEANKSCGCDGIYGEHLKYSSTLLLEKLSSCFISFLIHGFLPESMMSVILIPYRPIALASIIKILEIIILDRISGYITTNSDQFGFEKNHGTDQCIYTLKEIVVFNVCMDELSDKLNKEQIGCFGNKIINHLMYADDVVIMAPSSAGLSTLLEICESFGSKHCVKFNPLKSAILIFRSKLLYKSKLPNFSLNQNIQEVNKIKYLGHIISNDCSDDVDIRCQRRHLYARANTILRKFHVCNWETKITLFWTYCSSMYTAHLWWKYRRATISGLCTSYHNILKMFLGLSKYESTSMVCTLLDVQWCRAVIRRLVYSFWQRLRSSSNTLIIALWSSDHLHESRILSHWHRLLHT